MKRFLVMLAWLLIFLLPLSAMARDNEWICTQCHIWVTADVCAQCGGNRPAESAAQSECQLNLAVSFDKNLFFSKFDVDVLMDGQRIFTMEHGEDLEGTLVLAAGRHEMVFRNAEDYREDQRIALNITQDVTFSAQISTNRKGVKLEDVQCSAIAAQANVLQGETAYLNGVQMTLQAVRQSGGFSACEPLEGYVFVMVEFELQSLHDDDIDLKPDKSFRFSCDGYSVQRSSRAASVAPMGFASSIAGGEQQRAMLCFELPEDWQELNISYGSETNVYDCLTFHVTSD